MCEDSHIAEPHANMVRRSILRRRRRSVRNPDHRL